MTQSVLPPLGDPSLHFWITHSVARSMGVQFSEAMARGMLSKQDYAALVTTCRQCAHVAECFARLGRPGGAEEHPDYCANRDTLQALAGQV